VAAIDEGPGLRSEVADRTLLLEILKSRRIISSSGAVEPFGFLYQFKLPTFVADERKNARSSATST